MAKFKVTFLVDRCKGCENCIEVCPKHLLALDEQTTNERGYHPACIQDMDACIGCASCALMCPDCAITIDREEEA